MVTQDACPRIYSSDGGVHRNTNLGSDCQNTSWTRSNAGLHALWLFGMDGADQTGDALEDLYFGTQDNGSFAATDAGAANPTWSNKDCCDVFDVTADPNRVLYTVCCSRAGRRNRLFLRNQGMTGGGEINTYPASGLLAGFNFIDNIDRFDDKGYILVTASCRPADGIDNDGDGNIDEDDEVRGCPGFGTSPGGIFITTDITAGTIAWTPLPAGVSNACGVKASATGGTPTFYVQAGNCDGAGGQLWRYTGTATTGAWTRADFGLTIVGIFAVDPNNPNRLYASDLAFTGPRMVFSTDGGVTWNPDTELDSMMTQNGLFRYQTRRGPTDFTGFSGYSQPSLLAYDPEDGNILVAGGRDSGIFLSTDGGQNWGLLTDPLTSNTSGIPHLPRPWFAYFDHEPSGTINIYIGTQGRGVWRFAIIPPTADAGGPYVTDEGVNVTLDGSGSSDPSGAALAYAWDFDNDGDFDDASGPNPVFDRVCQDGVFPVTLKVTAGGAFDTDQTTVTVNNVAPSVSLASNAPVNEGSPVTVTGIVTDPGCLDPLTATVNWGDGTPVEAISGTLENNRPDATLTFNTSHIYGDNGTFTAQVCSSDDDTTTCQAIALQIDNVNPTAEIDESNTVLVNGIPTFIAHAGEPLEFSGHSTDPGSDDLTLSWDWDDGPPSPDVMTTFLVNPPNPDPLPSPSVQPRDVTDVQPHAFTEACLYEISFLASDDDGGSASDAATVVITGSADRARSSGDWQHQFARQGHTDFDDSTLLCYLAIINHVSTVFNESRDASTIAAAHNALFLKQNGGSEIEQLDRELMTAWLNFANGAFEYDQMFDPDRDGIFTTFAEVMATAEAVRLSPASTTENIRDQKNLLQQLR